MKNEIYYKCVHHESKDFDPFAKEILSDIQNLIKGVRIMNEHTYIEKVLNLEIESLNEYIEGCKIDLNTSTDTWEINFWKSIINQNKKKVEVLKLWLEKIKGITL